MLGMPRMPLKERKRRKLKALKQRDQKRRGWQPPKEPASVTRLRDAVRSAWRHAGSPGTFVGWLSDHHGRLEPFITEEGIPLSQIFEEVGDSPPGFFDVVRAGDV